MVKYANYEEKIRTLFTMCRSFRTKIMTRQITKYLSKGNLLEFKTLQERSLILNVRKVVVTIESMRYEKYTYSLITGNAIFRFKAVNW